MLGAEQRDLPITFCSANTDHESSDSAGDHLAPRSEGYWRDHKSAKINAIRTRKLLRSCDIAVIRFGDKYKQWNAAFDAGICAALDIPYITLHDKNIIHALKEVDSQAMAWTTTPEEVVKILQYTTTA